MKAKTRVVNACKQMYDAYTDYSRKVLHIPVIPNYPKVSWLAGNRADGARGTWLVDGHEHPGAVDEVEAHFLERADYWLQKARRGSEPSAKDGKQ